MSIGKLDYVARKSEPDQPFIVRVFVGGFIGFLVALPAFLMSILSIFFVSRQTAFYLINAAMVPGALAAAEEFDSNNLLLLAGLIQWVIYGVIVGLPTREHRRYAWITVAALHGISMAICFWRVRW
jgi:hypothetical protein